MGGCARLNDQAARVTTPFTGRLPSTANDFIGIGFDSGDAASGNWFLLTRGSSGTTRLDLGAGATRGPSDVFMLVLQAMPNASRVGVHVFNVSNGTTAFKSFVDTNLPSASAFLHVQAQTGISSAGTSAELDLIHLVLAPANDGVFDVRHFGAVGDGTTDDSAAFRMALHATWPTSTYGGGIVEVPPGTYHLASNLDITRQTLLTGVTGGGPYNPSVLKFAAGAGIVVHSIGSFPPKWTGQRETAQSSVVQPTTWTAYEYRPRSIGASPHETGTAEPTWPTALGSTVTDGNVTWTPFEAEGRGEFTNIRNLRLVSTRLNDLASWAPNTTYDVGARVRRANDNRYYYEVIAVTGDARSGTTEPGLAGPGTWSHRLYSAADTIVDNEVTWQAKVHAGVLCLSRTKISECIAEDFTNAGFMAYGNMADSFTNASGTVISRCRVVRCGVGIYVFGGDCSAGLIDSCDVEAAGSGQPGTGGAGIIDASFLGFTTTACQVAATTGPAYLTPDGSPGFSSFLGCYSEADCPPSRIHGLVLGGDHGAGFDPTSYLTGYDSLRASWKRLWMTDHEHPKRPSIRLDAQDATHAFNVWLSNDDRGYAILGDRYEQGADPKGWIVRGLAGSLPRRITAYSQSKAREGNGQFRIFQGEWRGDANPYYLGFESKDDAMLRAGEQGVGAHNRVGDRYELATATPLYHSEVVAREGWTANTNRLDSANYLTYDSYVETDGYPSSSVEVNGHVYVARSPGLTGVAGTTTPALSTWTTTSLPNGIVAYTWRPALKRRVGDYGAPTTLNGRYYVVAAVAGPDANGYGDLGATEPNWTSPTIIDGDITWVDAGPDPGTTVQDGTVRWQCVGRRPTYVAMGASEGVATVPLANADRALTAAEAAHGTAKVTGALTASRTITFPSPPPDDSRGYSRCIRNATTGGFAVVVALAGAPGTVTIGAGKTAILGIDTGGVFRKAADV